MQLGISMDIYHYTRRLDARFKTDLFTYYVAKKIAADAFPDECWVWEGKRSNDRAIMYIGEQGVNVIRFLFSSRHPEHPLFKIKNLCGTKFCVNIKHWALITPNVIPHQAITDHSWTVEQCQDILKTLLTQSRCTSFMEMMAAHSILSEIPIPTLKQALLNVSRPDLLPWAT